MKQLLRTRETNNWPESQASNLEPLVLETSARPLELHSENWSRPTVLPRVFLLHKQAS